MEQDLHTNSKEKNPHAVRHIAGPWFSAMPHSAGFWSSAIRAKRGTTHFREYLREFVTKFENILKHESGV
jgi:hypothetical protein